MLISPPHRVATVREKSLEIEKFSKSGKFGFSQGNWQKIGVWEFQNFVKTEMSVAVFLIFRNW